MARLPWLFGLMLTLLSSVKTQNNPTFPDYDKLDIHGCQSHVEVTNGLGKNSSQTIFVDEYHDLEGRRGRLEIDYLEPASMYYFSNMNQAVVISNSGRKECTVYDLQKLPVLEDEVYWGWLDKEKKIFGPTAALYRPTKSPPVYLKDDKIRGITVNVFTAEDTVDDVKITYYFATPKWNKPRPVTIPVPIRITATGSVGLGSDISLNLNMTMDFVYFNPNLSSQFIFRLPTGLGCVGLKVPNDQVLPSIEEQYSFVSELYDLKTTETHVESSVVLSKIWFDAINNLVRTDTAESMEIQDLNTGVSYYIKPDDTCVMGPILNSWAENTHGLVGAMKNPKEFLQLDGNYYYIGRDFYRSIYCDIWETVKANKTTDPTMTVYNKVIYTYYFMVSKIEAITEGDRSYQPPVALKITGYLNADSEKPDFHIVYNLFDFDEADGRLFNKEMNVGKCFHTANQKRHFSLTFKPKTYNGTVSELLNENLVNFEMMAFMQIAVAARVSLIRLPNFQVSVQQGSFVAFFEMVDRPPIMAGFYNFIRNTKLANSMQQVQAVTESQDCATQCLETTNFLCKSFLFCAGDCYIGEFDGTGQWDDTESGNGTCDLYIRAVATTNYTESELSAAVEYLTDSVNNNRMVVSLLDLNSTDTVDFYGSDLTALNLESINPEFETVFTRNQLLILSLTTIEKDHSETLEECHDHCKLETTTACASFSYCPMTGGCRLSSVFLSSEAKESLDEVENATMCTVYRATPLQLFDQTPGKVPSFQGEKSYSNVTTKDQCANYCTREKSFKCRGFEFCEENQYCSLHKVHALDMGAMRDAPSTCTHFAMKYSSDFTNAGNVIVNDPEAETVFSVTLEECAKYCYDRPASSPCRSVNYCFQPGLEGERPLSQCVLNRITALDRNVSTAVFQNCTHYINGKLAPVGPTSSPVTTIRPPTSDEVFYPFKDISLGAYQAYIEITDKIESTTTYVEEYHNRASREGRLDRFVNGIKDSLYYFSDIQQVVAIGGKTCKVSSYKNFTFLNESIDWGWLDKTNLIVGPSAILWRKTLDSPQYVGKENVRGIDCSKFVTTDSYDSQVELTFYVPVSKWKEATGSNLPIPARVVANGTYSLAGRQIKLHKQVDFIHLRLKTPDSKEIAIPKGIGCPGLASRGNRLPPQLAEMFSFVSEKSSYFQANMSASINMGLNISIDLDRTWFDGEAGIVLQEYHTDENVPVKEITDYKNGISYIISNERCTINGIQPPEENVDNGKSGNSFGWKTAKDYLGLDGKFYYLGDETWRGIDCEVWESVKTMEASGIVYDSEVHTIYLSKDNFEDGWGTEVEFRIPIRIFITEHFRSTPQPYTAEYNIFNFKEYKDRLYMGMYTNTEQCFVRPEERKYFSITYQMPEDIENLLLEYHLGRLGPYMTNVIAKNTNMSPLRISSLEILPISDKIVIINGLLLERTPMVAQFFKYDQDQPALRRTVKLHGLKDMETCATLCLESPNFDVCKSFTYCRTDDKPDCFLSAKDASDVGNVTTEADNSTNCELYIRGNTNITDFGSPLNTVPDLMRKNQDKLLLPIPSLKTESEHIFIAPAKIDFRDIPFHVQDNYEMFQTKTRLKEGQSTVFLSVDIAGSAEECYEQCLKDTRLSCSSFSYCEVGDDNSRCRLTSIYFKDRNTEDIEQTETSTSCQLYRKRAIHFFEETVGKIPLVPGRMMTTGIVSDQECAVACKNEIQFRCQGFEYCQSSTTCVLHDTHMLDIPEESFRSGGEFCTHYHLSYTAEFKDIGSWELKDPQKTVVKDLSFQSCAQTCMTKKEFNCKSINYCELGECELNTVTVRDQSQLLEKSTRGCHHYVSVSTYDQDVTTPKPTNVTDKPVTKPTNVTDKPVTNPTNYPTDKPKPTSDPMDEVFPEIQELFFAEFEVQSETTNRKENTSTFADELHDIKYKRGRVNNLSQGGHPSIFYFSDTRQIVSTSEKKCDVIDYTDPEFADIFPDWAYVNVKYFIVGPSAILFRETNEIPHYKGRINIRGVECNKYIARDKLDTGITLEYFFSVSDWTSVSGLKLPVPVRVTALGAYSSLGQIYPVDLQVDFMRFKPSKATIFETFMLPKGLGCEGLKPYGKRTLPKVEEQFSYTEEIFVQQNELESTVIYSKNYFDGLGKYFKTTGFNFWELEDYNTGVAYSSGEGKCKVGPINSYVAREGSSGMVTPMKTAKQLFHLDGNVYYLGKEWYSQVHCEVWETVKTNHYYMGKFYERIVVTAHFTSQENMVIPRTSAKFARVQVPVSITYKLFPNRTSSPTTFLYNFFDFDESEGRIYFDDMNIEPCLTEDQREHFMIYFGATGQKSDMANANRQTFHLEALLKIAEAAQVSLLRVKIIQIFYNIDNIVVMGMLFDRAPFINSFELYGNNIPVKMEQKPFVMVKDPEACARLCLEEKDFVCKGFSQCTKNPSKEACFLTAVDMSEPDKWGKDNLEYNDCTLYFRTTSDSKEKIVTLKEATQILNDQVSQGKLKLQLADQEFPATFMDDKVLPIDFGEDSHYELAVEKRRLDKESQTTLDLSPELVGSAVECYDRCQAERRIDCVTFSFCKADHSCRLSSVFVAAVVNDSLQELEDAPATSCDVYRKNAINLFDAYPGRTSMSNGDKSMIAETPEECALKCQEEPAFKCRGFEFCDAEQSGCILHKTHMLDLPLPSKKGPVCTYYAAKFSTEFADLGRFVLIDPTSTSQEAVSFQECTKLCSEAEGDQCKSFNYCPDMKGLSRSRCDLNRLSDKDKRTSLVVAQTCSYYFKTNLKDDTFQPSRTSQEVLVSGKRFTGISFALVFVGLAIGIAAYVVAAWYKKRRHNPSGVNIRYVASDLRS